MSVFTIYCHGTGGHRHKEDKEIIANFGRSAQQCGTEYKDFLILDGVGGNASKKKHPGFAMAGTFNWADKQRRPKGSTHQELGGNSDRSGRGGGSVVNKMTGHGLEDNARHAAVVIANLKPMPDTVNLIGWSRGAVTALRIANLLNNPDHDTIGGLFPQIKVNIFAVDPVAGNKDGLGDRGRYYSMIPRSVKNYVGILATGENRKTFLPQDLSRIQIQSPMDSNVIFLPFPGKHSTVAQNCDKLAEDVSNIVWSLADHFLKKFGSKPGTDSPLKTLEFMLEAYSVLVRKKNELSKIVQKGVFQRAIGKGFAERPLKNQLDDYTMHTNYFVNEHHRQLFRRCAPLLYLWLFTRQFVAGNDFPRTVQSDHPVFRELHRLGGQRDFILSLQDLEVVNQHNVAYNLPPAGKFFKAEARTNLHSTQQHANLWEMGLLW